MMRVRLLLIAHVDRVVTKMFTRDMNRSRAADDDWRERRADARWADESFNEIPSSPGASSRLSL